jgi:hypothetical protein
MLNNNLRANYNYSAVVSILMCLLKLVICSIKTKTHLLISAGVLLVPRSVGPILMNPIKLMLCENVQNISIQRRELSKIT